MYNIFVKKYLKIAFSITEAIIVMAILGIIAALCIPQILTYNYNDEANITMGKKMVSYMDEAFLEVLLNHATLDDFTRLKDADGYFSIEDDSAEARFVKLIKNYLLDIPMKMDMTKEYFNSDILDYDKTSTGEKLIDAYKSFFYANDGVIAAFRFYADCNQIEKNANPPEFKGRFAVTDSCGSVFFDVNAYKRPNKLGSDQFIVPIYKRGLKYDNI